jgi:hypothetical protein
MVGGRPRENEDVVEVSETEVEAAERVVDKALEGLGGVAEAEGHERKFEKTKMSRNSGFGDIRGMNRNLVVRTNKVDFREKGAPREVVGIVMDMTNGVTVGDSTGDESPIVTTGMPTVVLLRNDVKRRGPRSL